MDSIFHGINDSKEDKTEHFRDDNTLFSLSEQLKGLSVALKILERYYLWNDDIKNLLVTVERDLHVKRQSSITQADIRSFLLGKIMIR